MIGQIKGLVWQVASLVLLVMVIFALVRYSNTHPGVLSGVLDDVIAAAVGVISWVADQANRLIPDQSAR